MDLTSSFFVANFSYYFSYKLKNYICLTKGRFFEIVG